MVTVLTYWDSAAFAMFSWYTELMPDTVCTTAQEEVRTKQYQNRKNSIKEGKKYWRTLTECSRICCTACLTYSTVREILSRECNSNYVNSFSVKGMWFYLKRAYIGMSPKLAGFTLQEFLSWAYDSVVVKNACNVGNDKESRRGGKMH